MFAYILLGAKKDVVLHQEVGRKVCEAGGGQSAVQKEEKKTTEKIDACFDGGYTEGWCDRG